MDLDERARFEQIVLPHLDAAFNLARWMLRSGADAEDVAQEALLRAYRFFGGFHGGDARAWLLQIVRNTCYTWLGKNRPMETMEFDETHHSTELSGGVAAGAPDRPQLGGSPEAQAIASEDRERLTRALEELPPRFREVLVLRFQEQMKLEEIAKLIHIPVSTVKTRIYRGVMALKPLLRQPSTGGAR